MHWLLQEYLRLDRLSQFLWVFYSLFMANIAMNILFMDSLDDCLSFRLWAFVVLVAFMSLLLCCTLVRTLLVAKCMSLNPFAVLPLLPTDDAAIRMGLDLEFMDQVEDKCASFGKSGDRVVHRYEELCHTYRYLPNPVPVRRFDVDLYYRKAGFDGRVSSRGRYVESASRVNAPPAELTDEVDLLCERFAAMHLVASAQASASVQHQDEPSSLMPVANVSDAVGMPSLEDEADADSLAYQHNTASTSTGTPDVEMEDAFYDVEMEDSFYDDSHQGPVAMEIDDDSLSVEGQDQEGQQQESPAGFHATGAMHAAAELAFMPPAQEQPLPEEDSPVHSADDLSDSDSDSGHEMISVAGTVEDSEHEQEVGDSTALSALASAIAANMLPALEQPSTNTVGNASLVDVSSDFPTMTNAATVAEEFNDGGEDDDDEEVRPGDNELEDDVEVSHFPRPQTTPAPTVEDIFDEIINYDSDEGYDD